LNPDPIRIRNSDSMPLRLLEAGDYRSILIKLCEYGAGSRRVLREALKREHPALQRKFLILFLLLWVIFARLDPDSDRILNYGSGYTEKYGFKIHGSKRQRIPDQDPKHERLAF
jgi:hypothetical protein